MSEVREEKYWVGSNGEEPERIYFSEETARAAALVGCHRYLDAFDKDGTHLRAYKIALVEKHSDLPEFPVPSGGTVTGRMTCGAPSSEEL